MRRCFLVTYDIRDSRRLQRIHKLMKGYGEHWQYSVFFCVLKEVDRIKMQQALEVQMNLKVDQVVVVDLGSNEDAARESIFVLGASLPRMIEGVVVL
jgi:CRISPR-associated protein Cas2